MIGFHALVLLFLIINLRIFDCIEVFQTIDCETLVTIDNVSYKGCKYLVPTESLHAFNNSFKTINSFRAIPYAKPPIDELRFRKPEPIIHSEPVVIGCQFYSKACMQPDFTSGQTSEDCLYLNVWTPTLEPTAKLPVMFFIHGGGFTVGSGNQIYVSYISLSNVYAGEMLALRDVVVVNFNYRLGVWGWLYCNTSDCPGNMGYWDQTMALNWTKQYIEHFGGDPNQLTVFGESAGSIAISNHIVSNVTRNMFKRAIMQSGSAYNNYWSKDTDYAYSTARKFASDARLFADGQVCADDHTWVKCLRNKSSSDLLNAQQLAKDLWLPHDPWITVVMSSHFRPVYGDQFMPLSVNRAVKVGNFRKDIELMIGHNEMEGALITLVLDWKASLFGRYLPFIWRPAFISKTSVFNDIKNVFVDNQTIAQTVANAYTKPFNRLLILLNPNPIRKAAVHMFGDYSLTCPTVLFASYIRQRFDFTGKVFQYRLTYGSSQSIASYSYWADVSHTDELPLVFGHPFKPMERALWNDDDRKLSKQIMDIWTHFAKYGEVPEVNGKVWPQYGFNATTNKTEVKYIEFHANDQIMGRIHGNSYDGIDDYRLPVINNCFNFWDQIISDQFV